MRGEIKNAAYAALQTIGVGESTAFTRLGKGNTVEKIMREENHSIEHREFPKDDEQIEILEHGVRVTDNQLKCSVKTDYRLLPYAPNALNCRIPRAQRKRYAPNKSAIQIAIIPKPTKSSLVAVRPIMISIGNAIIRRNGRA